MIGKCDKTQRFSTATTAATASFHRRRRRRRIQYSTVDWRLMIKDLLIGNLGGGSPFARIAVALAGLPAESPINLSEKRGEIAKSANKSPNKKR